MRPGSISVAITIGFMLALFYQPLYGQIDDPASGELLENFFRDNEQASETDAQLFLENLENLRLRPLNLNTASREDLNALHLLNEIQIENFLNYRSTIGLLLNQYELQAIPGWEVSDIKRILPYAGFSTDINTRNISLWRGLWEGENDLILRWGRQEPVRYTTSSIEGEPNNWALRYRHSFDNRMRFGFTAENDPGEAFFKGSNSHGFDFYSGHFFLQDLNKTVKTIALGDYSARFGQGLLLQTGFAPGKSAESTSVARGGRKLRPYASFGEAYFFRGAATTLQLGKKWEITALFSARRRDGNVLAPQDSIEQDFPDIVFTSLQTSGLHRSPAEIADEKKITEWVGGASLTRIWKNGQVSANGLFLQYDKPWQPSLAPYRQFVFTGTQLSGASVDYFWRQRNWYIFGEFARSDNGGMSALNGVLFSAERHVTLALVHRNLRRDYQSVYAAPFAEVSGASNEQGLYLGADVRFGRKWQINSYVDIWKHPWLRFGVDGPSTGSEYLSRITWNPQRGISIYALWQMEIKERNSDVEGLSGLVDNKRSRLRLHASYKVGQGLELRSRVEWSRFEKGAPTATHGFLAYQEAVIRPLGSALTGSVRYAIFDTEDYDSRIYTYENDLFSAISIPGFAGRGARYFLNLSWRVNKWLGLESRVEQTLQRKAVTTSGFTGRQTEYKIQVRMQF